MTDLTSWLVAAGILVVAELFTGTFYLLMIAIGLAFGALAAWLGLSGPLQTFAAASVGLVATAILHRSRFGRPARMEATRDSNVNLDIGQRVVVDAWQGGRARVMYRGALWDVELGPGAQPEAGDFRIVEVLGSRLIVANS
ncbi:NfeD family protein [Massilia sp. G4R7]|uniref:NfeD family protein n=1 Tax=Massilia phyllostachyos TaxID=2898585 RepID=A0ABS8QCD9_9BURK|nr:NfeD family protein [Massilia phyllostachyos]MCD2519424.1 NfeD family protein [Massilia phyllostachyos]